MKQIDLDKKWLQEIRQRLTDEAPIKAPENAWDDVVSSLPKNHNSQQREKRIMPLFYHIAAAIFLLIVVSLLIYSMDNVANEDKIMVDKGKITMQIEPHLAQDIQNSDTTEYINIYNVQKSDKHILKNDNSTSFKDDTLSRTTVDSNQNIAINRRNHHTDSVFDEEKFIPKNVNTYSKNKVSINGWSLSFNIGGGNTNMSNNSKFISNKGNSNPIYGSTNDSKVLNVHPANGQTIIDIKNNWTWNLGFSVRKQITKKIALESGLIYTFLSSDISFCDNENTTYILPQKLHYLGIPFSISVIFFEKSRWQLYSSVGFMIEHNIHASLGNKAFSINEWQWSVNGALGLQYNLNKHLGVYTEPRRNYYFDDYSGVPSVRTVSPWDLNLQLGLRVFY